MKPGSVFVACGVISAFLLVGTGAWVLGYRTGRIDQAATQVDVYQNRECHEPEPDEVKHYAEVK